MGRDAQLLHEYEFLTCLCSLYVCMDLCHLLPISAAVAWLRAKPVSAVRAPPKPGPWTIHSIRATLPDGGGAQSIGIALQSGSNRKTAMLLLNVADDTYFAMSDSS